MKKLSLQEKQIFTSELEMILSSGLGIAEGLQIIEEQLPSESLKEAVRSMKQSFMEEQSFYKAIQKTGQFDAYMEQMVRVGEQSGHLDRIMKELSQYYQRQDDMRAQIKEACTYPFILLVIMFVIVGIMVFKVLPIFEDVMKNAGTSSNGLMIFGQRFGQISFIVLLAGIVISLFAVFVFTRPKNAQQSARLLSSFPLTRKMYLDLSLARFTYGLSLFVSSGYPMEEAISLLRDLVSHPELKQKMSLVQQDMEKGESFMKSILQHQIYRGTFSNMLAIGVYTGKQDQVLARLASLYEKEVETSTSRFLNIVEPLIIALLSVVVGVILLSIMLPLLGILSALG